MTTKEQKEQVAAQYHDERVNNSTHSHYKAFIAGADWAESQVRWIPVEEALPAVIEKKMKPVLGLNGKHAVIVYYFPYHFKTVEWEDWDDYSPDDFPYTELDTERECVWLRPGFYYEVECNKCDGYWSSPLPISHWMPLPAPPAKEDGQDGKI